MKLVTWTPPRVHCLACKQTKTTNYQAVILKSGKCFITSLSFVLHLLYKSDSKLK